MNSFLRDTDADWKSISETEPYWGVLSDDRYRRKDMNKAAFEAFMLSGETYVDNVLAFIKKHYLPNFTPKRILDVGCGVGRLTIPFARRADEVVGVDVAPRMLELCAQHAKEAHVKNVLLVQGDDRLSNVDGDFDLINTFIVLQHIPPYRGYQLIDAMLKRLRKGSFASLQLTFAKSREFFPHENAKAEFYRREGNTIIDILPSENIQPEGVIQMYDYDLNQVFAQIMMVSGSPVLIHPTNDHHHLGLHMIFRKAR